MAMMARTGRRTVPQIYIGDVHVGGYDDLVALDHAGRLAPLLAGEAATAPANSGAMRAE
jgi:glutaredoxin 3